MVEKKVLQLNKGKCFLS